jgi:hypothetical protein
VTMAMTIMAGAMNMYGVSERRLTRVKMLTLPPSLLSPWIAIGAGAEAPAPIAVTPVRLARS